MKEPSQEEIKRFWEHWGFKHLPIRPLPDRKPHPTLKYWLYPDGKEENELPPIDLNSLFKYAVPKLFWDVGAAKWEITMKNWVVEICLRDMLYKPELEALALFWAINKIIEGEE